MLEKIVERTLDNGMKVICLRKADTPIVSLQVWYRAGSVYERPGIRGISHFVEHMMFRGSEHVGPVEHARRINDVGGHCNAFTAEDVTAFVNAVPREHVPMLFELEADRMRGLRFDPAILETERKVMIEEYQTYMNNPVTKAFLEFRSAFFGDRPYAESPLGRLEDVQRIGVDDCRKFFSERYVPANAFCVVVGDFAGEEEIFGHAAATFGRIPAGGTVPEPSFDVVPVVSPGRMERRIDFDVPLLVMGFPAPCASDERALSLEILQLILSQGQTGRLHRELVRSRGVAVMAGGANHFFRRTGISLFFALYTPDIAARVVEEALAGVIAGVRSGDISRDDMEKVRNTTLTNRVFELYSAEHLCQRIGYSEALEGGYGRWVKRLETLEKLSVEQVRDAAATYWDDSARHVLVLRPRKVALRMRAAGLARRLFVRAGRKVRADA